MREDARLRRREVDVSLDHCIGALFVPLVDTQDRLGVLRPLRESARERLQPRVRDPGVVGSEQPDRTRVPLDDPEIPVREEDRVPGRVAHVPLRRVHHEDPGETLRSVTSFARTSMPTTPSSRWTGCGVSAR